MDAVILFFSKYKDALITVGWLLAALGWQVSNNQANKRERRKETRAEIEAISKAALEVVAKARKYYGLGPLDPEDDARAAEIAFDVKRVLIRAERLNRRVMTFKDSVIACGELFDATTEGPFTSKQRDIFAPGSALLQGIEAAAHNVMDKLEEGFDKAYS